MQPEPLGRPKPHESVPWRTMTGPGSLDDLPRPLADRERRGGGRRRLGAVAIAAVVAAIGVGITTSLASGPFTPVGDVQGAVGTPSAPATQGAGSPTPDSPSSAPAASSRPVTVPPDPTPSAIPLPADPGTLEGYRSPLPHGRLTLPFGPSPWGSRIVAGEPFHDGIDLATFCGDRIVAAHGGTVLAAGRRFDEVMGWVGDLGPYLDRLERKALWSTLPIMVVIDDGNGYRSMYAHFTSIDVRRGDVVKAGQLLGHEGRDGASLRLPSPLRAVQSARDGDVRDRSGGGAPDAGPRPPDRASGPAPRLARARRPGGPALDPTVKPAGQRRR